MLSASFLWEILCCQSLLLYTLFTCTLSLSDPVFLPPSFSALDSICFLFPLPLSLSLASFLPPASSGPVFFHFPTGPANCLLFGFHSLLNLYTECDTLTHTGIHMSAERRSQVRRGRGLHLTLWVCFPHTQSHKDLRRQRGLGTLNVIINSATCLCRVHLQCTWKHAFLAESGWQRCTYSKRRKCNHTDCSHLNRCSLHV